LQNQDDRRSLPPLASRLSVDASAEQVAETVVAVWLEIERALNPVIGHRGVGALYNRSLKLASPAYPWLAIGPPDVLAAVDLQALKATLAQQAAVEAAAGGGALFHAFHGLLASLVGDSLTERLLRSVWAPSAGASPAQDTLP
jgi:hypothetical protein